MKSKVNTKTNSIGDAIGSIDWALANNVSSAVDTTTTVDTTAGTLTYSNSTGKWQTINAIPVPVSSANHNHSNIYTTTGTSYSWVTYESETDILRRQVKEMDKNMKFLMKFLIMKGLIENEKEFEEFVDAMKLADTLAEKDKPEETFGWHDGNITFSNATHTHPYSNLGVSAKYLK